MPLIAGVNDLTILHPELAAEWHPTKNGELTPDQFTISSHQSVWWLGKCGHEWETVIKNRSRNSQGCPICSNKKVLVGFNDLATVNPTLATEWHPTRNGKLSSKHVTVSSGKKVWWLGKCGHEWETFIYSRHGGNGCPVCANQLALVGYNDLATLNPELAAEWHPAKNGELTPEQLVTGSTKVVWWIGKCGHEWNSSVSNRMAHSSCPICFNRRVLAGFNDLATLNPELAAEWHPTKNGELTPDAVVPGSGKRVWWLCGRQHEWIATLTKRTASGRGCPVCSNMSVLAGFNDLATLNPELAAEWHPTKNGELTPDTVIPGSHAKVWWLGRCGHEWMTALNKRVLRGSGCPVCINQVVLVGFNDLASQKPELAAEWHPTKNGELTPDTVIPGSTIKVWWLGNCGHEWKANIRNRNRGVGCPVCANQLVLAGYNDLVTFNPELAAEWHPTKNGERTPDSFISGSETKVWWIGKCGHEWKAAIKSRSIGSGCSRCSKRISKAEQTVNNFLVGLGLSVESSNREILKGKEIDLFVPEKKVGIEFNGIYWHTEIAGKTKTYHYDKWRACKNQDIQLIQIWEDDWTSRSEIIKRALVQKLGLYKTGQEPEHIKVITVTEQQTIEFLNLNHLRKFASGSYYIGLADTRDIRKLQAVMVLNTEHNRADRSLEITRYASKANASDDFSKLLFYAFNAYMPESVTVITDHCEGDDDFYVSHNFIAEKESPPDYMYVIRTERKPRSEYSIERFRDDPALLWEAGLTEMGLADLNGLNRIWDAGKTHYRLVRDIIGERLLKNED